MADNGKAGKAVKAREPDIGLELIALSAGTAVSVGGEELAIKPYTWSQTYHLARAMGVVARALDRHYKAFSSLKPTLEGLGSLLLGLDDADDVVPALTDLLAAASGKPAAFIEGLMVDDLLRLAMAVWEVNGALFTTRVRPLMPAATASPASPPAMSSPCSSPTDTAPAT